MINNSKNELLLSDERKIGFNGRRNKKPIRDRAPAVSRHWGCLIAETGTDKKFLNVEWGDLRSHNPVFVREGKWLLTEKDFEKGAQILETELVRPITKKTVFSALVYSILAQTEIYDKQLWVYKKLSALGLCEPNIMLREEELLKRALREARHPNQKFKRLRYAAEYWRTSDFYYALEEDLNNGRKLEEQLRDRLTYELDGVSCKTASLLMIKCGYQNLAIIDLWVSRRLRDIGLTINATDYKLNGGMNMKKYKAEEINIRKEAAKLDITTAHLCAAIYGKRSAWKASGVE